jgi:sterol desaturase/sphingolipid hydroxylase (fatty acid hydroxylase superfamily)
MWDWLQQMLWSPLHEGFNLAQMLLFEEIVQPFVFTMGAGSLLELAYEGTGWLLVGLLQVLVILVVIGALQRRWPVEPVRDHRTIRVDLLYTLFHRLGLFKLLMFFTLDPVIDQALGALRVAGVMTFHLDQWWPGVSDRPTVSFLVYLLVFDFLHYAIHRAQHRFNAWWSLHSLHHSQRQMTMWSDNRNHLLDDVSVSSLFVLFALVIGVPPSQFVAIVAVTQLAESLQHANVKIGFGTVGERLWISPRFHRMHHSIGLGHESAGRGSLGGCNFGVLLPWWDMLFRTANFEWRFDPTGVRDQVEQGRDYGSGFWRQQWLGLLRLAGRA